VKQRESAKLFRITDNGIFTWMVRATLNVPLGVLYKALHEIEENEEFWKAARPNWLAFQRLQKYNDNHSDCYIRMKLPFPNNNRDFVVARHDYLNRQTALLLVFSVSREDTAVSKSYNRGEVISKRLT
jgi:hypothetical protein